MTIFASGLCSATASATGLRVGDRLKVTGGSPAFNEYVTILSAVGTAITFQSINTPGSVTGTIRIGHANNMFDNTLLQTATGGTVVAAATGTAANGIKVQIAAGSPTVVASVVSRADGLGNDQQLVITPAAAGNQVIIEADFAFAATEWPTIVKAGRRYVYECELSLSGVAGSNLHEIRSNIQAIIDGTTYQVYAMNGYSDGPVINTDLTAFHVKTAPMYLPAGASVTNFKFVNLFSFSAAGTALTVKVGRIKLSEYES